MIRGLTTLSLRGGLCPLQPQDQTRNVKPTEASLLLDGTVPIGLWQLPARVSGSVPGLSPWDLMPVWVLASPVPRDEPGLSPKLVADFEKQDLSPRRTESPHVLHPGHVQLGATCGRMNRCIIWR